MEKINSEILDLPSPQNLEAEISTIGSLLHDSRLCDVVAPILRDDDFYVDANQKLYKHIKALHDNGKRVDARLLLDGLKRAGDFEAVGGTAYLAEVAGSVPYAANAAYYAEIVKRMSDYRLMRSAAIDLLRDAQAAQDSPEDILSRAEKELSAITIGGEFVAKPKTIQDTVIEALDRIEAIKDRKNHIGLFTGIENFDSVIGGLFPGELFILAARTGVGKTALACQIADYVSGAGKTTLLFSLEMSRIELATRMICSSSGVSSVKIRKGDIRNADFGPLTQAGNALGNQSLVIVDRPAMTTNDIRREARRLSRQGLSLVIVDYLQRLTPTDRKVQRHEQVGMMTDALKSLARELNVPVLCLAQLNRAAEKEDRPGLHHLRESGSIEQDADVVAILHRQVSSFRDDNKDRDAELLLAKNRNGQTGTFVLTWEPDRTRFVPRGQSHYIPSRSSNYEPDFAEFG